MAKKFKIRVSVISHRTKELHDNKLKLIRSVLKPKGSNFSAFVNEQIAKELKRHKCL